MASPERQSQGRRRQSLSCPTATPRTQRMTVRTVRITQFILRRTLSSRLGAQIVSAFCCLALIACILSSCSANRSSDSQPRDPEVSRSELSADAQSHYGSAFAGVISEGSHKTRAGERTRCERRPIPRLCRSIRSIFTAGTRRSTRQTRRANDRTGEQREPARFHSGSRPRNERTSCERIGKLAENENETGGTLGSEVIVEAGGPVET